MSSRYFALLDMGGTDLKSAIVLVGTNKDWIEKSIQWHFLVPAKNSLRK
jgi:hypothetical protein